MFVTMILSQAQNNIAKKLGWLLFISLLITSEGNTYTQIKRKSKRRPSSSTSVKTTHQKPTSGIPKGSPARTIPNEVQKSDAVISEVISRAEEHFRKGKLNLEANNRQKAREEFDKAVDSILVSGLDIRASSRLKFFYPDLVERIYRLEVPLAEGPAWQPPQIGFREQKFEPSPLDKLGKLVLTEDGEFPTGQANTGEAKTPSKVPRNKCTLTADQLPEVRGLRLGQPFSTFYELFPNRYIELQVRKDDIGLQEPTVSPILLGHPKSLEGVSRIDLKYLDDKLVSMKVDYDTEVRWQSNLHFTSAIAEQLRLPSQGWQGRDPTWIICNGFYVETSNATFLPSLQVERTDLVLEIKKRHEELDRKKRIEFKP